MEYICAQTSLYSLIRNTKHDSQPSTLPTELCWPLTGGTQPATGQSTKGQIHAVSLLLADGCLQMAACRCNSFLAVKGKPGGKEELCSQYFVNVVDSQNLGAKRNYVLSILLMWSTVKASKEKCPSLWNLNKRKTFFVFDVSVNKTTGRRWKTKLLDTWKILQIH